MGHCNPAYLATNRGFDSQFGIQNSGGYNYGHVDYIPPYAFDFFVNDVPIPGMPYTNQFQMVLIINQTMKEYSTLQNSLLFH